MVIFSEQQLNSWDGKGRAEGGGGYDLCNKPPSLESNTFYWSFSKCVTHMPFSDGTVNCQAILSKVSEQQIEIYASSWIAQGSTTAAVSFC